MESRARVDTETPRGRRWAAVFVPAAIIAAVGAAAYANTFDVPFQFDDIQHIAEQGSVHVLGLDLSAFLRAASGFPTGRWLAYLSLAANHAMSGRAPAGYHAVNLAFHLASAVMAYFLALEVLARATALDASSRRRTALIAALLFVAHPVQTQAVTYVIQRMTSMGAFFAFVSLWAWLRARRSAARHRVWYAAMAVATGYLAFSCKENFAILPALALLLDALFEPRWRERVGRLSTVAAATVAATCAAWAYAPVVAAEQAASGVPFGHRLLSQGRILCHYLGLLLWPLPSRLRVDYSFAASTGWLSPATTLPAIAAIVVLASLGVALRRRVPLAALAAGWFALGLVIEQALPRDLVFEHRLYFPSFGPLLLAAYAIDRVAAVLAPPIPIGVAPWAIATPAVFALAAGAFTRNEVWRDPVRLYAQVDGTGAGAVRSLLTLAVEYRHRGRIGDAEAALRRALQLAPTNLAVHVELANAASDRGDLAESERWLREATRLAPTSTAAWNNLAWVLIEERRFFEAFEAVRRVLALDPVHVPSLVNRGFLYSKAGELELALADLDTAVRLDPGAALAYQNRARVRAAAGNLTGSMADVESFAHLSRDAAGSELLRGECLAAAGRRNEAREAFERALRIRPGDASASKWLHELGF